MNRPQYSWLRFFIISLLTILGALIKKAIGSNHYLIFLKRVRLRKEGGMGYPFFIGTKNSP